MQSILNWINGTENLTDKVMKNCRDCIHCTDKGGHLACDYPAMCFQGDGKGNYDKVGFKPKKQKLWNSIYQNPLYWRK